MAIAPPMARVRRDGVLREVPVADVRIGDLLVVNPGERMPVDGVIVAGESAFDESPVTGESWPVEKAPGDDVFAGTINGTGAIDVAARRLAADSTIARIIHLVEHAQKQRAPVQSYVDRFARRYTPAVVVLAVLVVAIGPLATGGLSGWSGRV